MLQAGQPLTCMAPLLGRRFLSPSKLHWSSLGKMRMGSGLICVSSSRGFQPIWLCAGLRLGLSIFEGRPGRALLNQGCAGTRGSRGRMSSGCRGNFSHHLCAERKGLFSLLQVSPESGAEDKKGICASGFSHQGDDWGKAPPALQPGCYWLFAFSNMPKDTLKQFLLHK